MRRAAGTAAALLVLSGLLAAGAAPARAQAVPLGPEAFDARGFDRLGRSPPWRPPAAPPSPPHRHPPSAGILVVPPPAWLLPPPPMAALPPPPERRPIFTDGWTRDGFGSSR